jgi:hypothetical protein
MNLLNKALLENRWLWFHILAGGMAAKLIHLWFDEYFTFGVVLAAAIGWEVYEGLTSDLSAIYGSDENFVYDAVGDIFGAVIMCLIVIV